MTPAQSRVHVSDPSCGVQGDPSVSPSQTCSGAGLRGQPGQHRARVHGAPQHGTRGHWVALECPHRAGGHRAHPECLCRARGAQGTPRVPPWGPGSTMCSHSACEQDMEGMGVPTPRASVGCPCAKAELSPPPRASQVPVGPWQNRHGPVPPSLLQIPVPCHCPVPRTAPGTHWHMPGPHGTRGMRGWL